MAAAMRTTLSLETSEAGTLGRGECVPVCEFSESSTPVHPAGFADSVRRHPDGIACGDGVHASTPERRRAPASGSREVAQARARRIAARQLQARRATPSTLRDVRSGVRDFSPGAARRRLAVALAWVAPVCLGCVGLVAMCAPCRRGRRQCESKQSQSRSSRNAEAATASALRPVALATAANAGRSGRSRSWRPGDGRKGGASLGAGGRHDVCWPRCERSQAAGFRHWEASGAQICTGEAAIGVCVASRCAWVVVEYGGAPGA